MSINLYPHREEWKDIEGFPGYQVSNRGRVRSFRDNRGNVINDFIILSPRINKDGYCELTIYTAQHKKVTKRVHRLVACAFLGEHVGLVVNHIDGNKLNNNIENLEFVTAEANSTLAAEAGLYKTKPIRISETGEVMNSIRECADKIGCHPSDISHCLSGRNNSVKGLHFEYCNNTKPTKKPFLYDHQKDAVERMFNGCILNGGVGSGKSRTSLYYYFTKQGGNIEPFEYMKKGAKDLYIITTARKRDSKEWELDMAPFLMSTNAKDNSLHWCEVTVDSWNNIGKYSDVRGAFFIFDEQRVVGSGTWVKAFLKIAKANEWILLSASPGDKWEDYIPVFLANGFYKNKTEFNREHIVYSRWCTKFPRVEKYLGVGRLERLRNRILIDMDFNRKTVAHHHDVYVKYDIPTYKDAVKTRWDPYKNEPIQQAAGLCYVLRRIVNEAEDRQSALLDIVADHPRCIIFYNFDYELDILRRLAYMYNDDALDIAEWNGHKHQPIPTGDRWVYLVQYTSGCEGWNCITTDTIIFYSQNYSYKIMQQACGRIDRLNTPYTDLYYYHLKSRSGIDLAISKALRDKKKFNERKFTKWSD